MKYENLEGKKKFFVPGGSFLAIMVLENENYIYFYDYRESFKCLLDASLGFFPELLSWKILRRILSLAAVCFM